MKTLTKDVYSPSQIESIDPCKSKLEKIGFTFVDLFAGIGGFRIALEELGGKCLGYSEIDKAAIEVYEKILLIILIARISG